MLSSSSSYDIQRPWLKARRDGLRGIRNDFVFKRFCHRHREAFKAFIESSTNASLEFTARLCRQHCPKGRLFLVPPRFPSLPNLRFVLTRPRIARAAWIRRRQQLQSSNFQRVQSRSGLCSLLRSQLRCRPSSSLIWTARATTLLRLS